MAIRAAVIQLKVVADKTHNLRRARALIGQAATEGGADLCVLPEAFTGTYGVNHFARNAEKLHEVVLIGDKA